MNRLLIIIGITLIILACANGSAFASSYRIQDLGVWNSVADINSKGQIVGVSSDYTGQVWDPITGFTTLNLVSTQTRVYPTGINDAGTIAATTSSGEAYKWDANGATKLIGLTNKKDTPHKINNSGQIIGASYSLNSLCPVIWDTDGTITNIGTIDDINQVGWANDINDNGQVVGRSGNYAFVWSKTSGMQNIGDGEAKAINSNGLVVLNKIVDPNSSAKTNGYIWNESTGLTQVSKLSGWSYTGVADINDSGQAIGYAIDTDGYYIPVVWNSDGSIVELTTLSDTAGSYGRAVAINNYGWIVGYSDGHAVLWQPAPEPISIVSLLGGLLGLGGFTLRKRKA